MSDHPTPAEKQAEYVDQRSIWREMVQTWLASRELPGSPVTKIDTSRARKVEDPILGWAP